MAKLPVVEGWEDRAPWEIELRGLFAQPLLIGNVELLPGLVALLPEGITRGASPTHVHLTRLFTRALAYGDSRTADGQSPKERDEARKARAWREGARGTFWLPRTDREDDGSRYPSAEERYLVYSKGSRRSDIQDARRWAGLRWNNAAGKANTEPGSFVVLGRKHLNAFCVQLVDDLKVYLHGLTEGEEQAELSLFADRLAEEQPEQAGLFAAAFADRLDKPAPRYPSHLTPSVLASTMTLSRWPGERGASATPGSMYGGPRTSGGQPALDVLRQTRRAVLLGDPGSGKSTILAAAAIRRIRDEGSPITIACPLSAVAAKLSRELLNREISQILEYLVEVSVDHYASGNAFEPTALAEALRTKPEGLIALDGLDEVPAEKRHLVAELIRKIEPIESSILITSRHVGYERLERDWTEFNTDRLTSEQARDFLGQWFGDENPDGHRRALQAIGLGRRSLSGAHRRTSIGEIPVLLGIVADVASDGEVPDRSGQLYEMYLERFFQRSWQRMHPNQRLTGPEIDRRLAVAERIAFAMMRGAGFGVSGGSQDVAIKADLYVAVTDEERPLLEEMLAIDGILVPHGQHRYERAQPVRWLHKTVHEFLVGSYLARLFRTDRSAWEAHFTYALQLTSAWAVPLEFMMTSLDERDHDEVFRTIEAFASAGDPGRVIRGTARSMAEMTSPGSLFRQRLAGLFVQAEDWDGAFRIDERTWHRLLRHRLDNGSQRFPALGFTSFVKAAESEELGKSLRAAVRRALAASDNAWVSTIRSLWGNQPNIDLWFYAELLRWGPCGSRPELEVAPRRYSPAAVSTALNALADAEEAAQLEFVRFVSYTGVDLRQHIKAHPWLDNQPLVHEVEPIVFDFDNFEAELEAAERPEAALRGVFGSSAACEIAQKLSTENQPKIELLPWAIIGDWLHTLEHPERDVEVSPPSAAELAHAMRALTEDPNSKLDPADLLPLLRAAVVWVRHSYELTNINVVLEVYRQLLRLPRRCGDVGAARASVVKTVDHALYRVLAAQQDAALRAVLASDPSGWADGQVEPTLPIALEFAAGELLDLDVLVDLAAWASKTSSDVVGLLHPRRVRTSDWLNHAELRGVKVESYQATSRDEIARNLSAEGCLPEWRDRLLCQV
ncbi:NACHT domain-containing protein [Microbacterium sp. ASV81]|uniref:NACHT domain-containing protein n=1 Tax=Microbacterium capsulatum TaxID=3041921 RepID=A0ABU0XHY7_9MICO|nr:NACHT domain-containing protein [Microbacterium sp. ASV81]MDQ4214754.1 NACHT domain-containing protein [Microbacterium sp. ASV81]